MDRVEEVLWHIFPRGGKIESFDSVDRMMMGMVVGIWLRMEVKIERPCM